MLKSPRRIASRTIATYPHLALHEHDLTDEEEGHAPSRVALTISLSDWAIAVAVTTEGAWVLVEQHRHGVDALTWEPAGGIVDSGEAEVDAAARELVEETGYAGGTVVSLGWVHPNPALSSNRAHFFLFRGVQRMKEPLQEADEQTRVLLLSRGELTAALAEGRITHALAVLALDRALAHEEAR